MQERTARIADAIHCPISDLTSTMTLLMNPAKSVNGIKSLGISS